MCTYLSKRGSTYYFRRAIPAELRPFLDDRSEWMVSLGVKDRAQAKQLIPAHHARTDTLINEASARHMSDQRNALDEGDIEAAEWSLADDSRREARREELADAIKFLEERLAGSTRQMPKHLRAMRFILDDVGFDKTVLRDQVRILKAEKDEQAAELAAARKAIPKAEANRTSPDHVPLLEIFDAYAVETGIKPGTAKEWRAVVQRLIAFLGHDDAAAITVDDLHRWITDVLTKPGKRAAPPQPRTVRGTYLAAIRAMFVWAVEQRKLKRNVAVDIKVRVPRKAKLRQPDFTQGEARAILSAALVPVEGNLAVENVLARRWIPWLCAYTGARVNEFSQLRAEDVQQIEGVWTARITPEAGPVKTNEARIVPLHSHLIEQGFLAVVASKGDGPLFYDPSRQRVNDDASRHVKKVGEKLAKWVREEVGITDPQVQPNHGWRHMFKTVARRVAMDADARDIIQGHALKTEGGKYGRFEIEALATEIEKLPRFDVPGLPTAREAGAPEPA
jgi:integrase